MPAELSVATEVLPKSQVGMTIEVPAEMVDATFERVLNRLVSRAKIEGFRPGRAPRALVEARLGPAVIREEVVETMIPDVIRRALEEKSIDPIDNPDVEVLELERGRPARLKATISVMPAVELADATRLKPETQAIEITDEMLERRLEDVREPLVEVDGEVVESESRKSMEAELKDGVLLPELLEALPGAWTDETRAVSVKFPDTYSEEKLAGKEATIRVTVRGVKEKIVPPLDDALAKTLSNGAQDTAEAYRAAVRTELEDSAAAMAKLDREQAIVRALVDASSVEVPETLVDRELTSELESMERSLNRQGLKLERYLEYTGKTLDQWMAAERPEAEARLKVDLVLGEFARRENLDPSEDDVTRFLEDQAAKDDELKDQVAALKKSPSARRYFTSRLRRQRVLERLVEVAGASASSGT
jgi:trigger factor